MHTYPHNYTHTLSYVYMFPYLPICLVSFLTSNILGKKFCSLHLIKFFLHLFSVISNFFSPNWLPVKTMTIKTTAAIYSAFPFSDPAFSTGYWHRTPEKRKSHLEGGGGLHLSAAFFFFFFSLLIYALYLFWQLFLELLCKKKKKINR